MKNMQKILRRAIVRKKIIQNKFLKYLDAGDRREVKELALKLRGRRIVHINATASGGGVAVLMRGILPYMNGLGVGIDWYTINGLADRKFFSITNKIHDALHGKKTRISKSEWARYTAVNRKIARYIDGLEYDVLVINDPQPLFSMLYIKNRKPSIFYSHIDTSMPDRSVCARVVSAANMYDRLVFSNKDFVNKNFNKNKVSIFTPAIDPLGKKQRIIPAERAKGMLARYGVKKGVTHIVQVSRFDIFKDPFGVIDAFRAVEKRVPNIQLTLAGFNTATDNPEAEIMFKLVRAAAAGRENIHIFYDPKKYPEIKDVLSFSGVIQNSADIIVQNSKKEGFGLTVTEAMWKKKPVIGGPASGIRMQITHGKNGYIAENTKELAKYILRLIARPDIGLKLGKEAHKTVVKKFLLPRLVKDHLNLYVSVLGDKNS